MDSRKKILISFFIVFLISFSIRFINLQIIKDNPFFNYPIMDEKYHDEWAQEIASGKLFERTPFYRAPGYPYFLGLIFAIFGHSYFIPRLIGIIIGALSCVLIYLIAREIFSHKVGILAGLLACFYGMLIYFDSMLLTVYLEIFFCLLGVFWILRWIKTQENLHIFIAGIFWGLACIVRPNFLIFVLVFAPYVLIQYKKRPMINRLKTIGLFICGILPFIITVLSINIITSKDTVLLAWNGGINFYLGNNPAANGWSATSPELDATWWGGYKDAILIAQENIGKKLSPSQVSNYWFKQGFNYIISKPFDWMLLMIRKIYLFFNSYELSNNQSIRTFKEFSPLYRIPLLNYGFIISLAVWGMVIAAKKRKAILIMLFLLSYSLSIVIFFVPARYRMPLVPFLLVFASGAVFWLIEKIKTQKYKQTLLAVAVLIGTVGFVHTDFYGTHRDIVKKSEVYATYGNQYYAAGKYDKAIEAYKKSLQLDPKNIGALNALGDTYLMLNRHSDAVRMYKESIKIEKNADALCKLGIINFQIGRFDSAQDYFSSALAIDATNPEIYYYKGMSYAFDRKAELAIKNLELSLKYYPDPKYINNIHYNLGKLYIEAGNLNKAKQHLLEAGINYKDVADLLKHIQ